MKQNLLQSLRLRFALLVALLCSLGTGTAWADSYTITFANNANSATAISSTTNASTVISNNGSRSYVTTQPFTIGTGNCYYGDTQTCIRIGKSGNASSLTIALSATGQVKATSIVVNCNNTGGKNNSDAELNVNSIGAQTTTTTADDYTFTFASATDIESIVLAGTASIRIYSITVNYTTITPCVTPTFYPAAGEVAKNTVVTISSTTTGSTIYYTTNGEDPTTDDAHGTAGAASATVTISNDMTVKAIAVKDGNSNSAVASAEYTTAKAANAISVTDGTTQNIALTGGSAVTSFSLAAITSATHGTPSFAVKSSENLTAGTEFTLTDGVLNFTQTYKGVIVVTASVTATDDYYGAEQDITVNCSGNLRTPQFLFDETELVSIGSTITVAAGDNVETDGNITLATSNAEVASVNSSTGVITGVAAGSCTITVTTAAGTYYAAGSTSFTLNVVDYAVLPFSFTSGKSAIATTTGMTASGLGTDYASGNPPLKFDNQGDCLILKFNAAPGELKFDIKGNSFSGGTFTVQYSADGSSYSELEGYTTLGDTQTKTITNIPATARYIKWIYTTKSSGNVGLGNIYLNGCEAVTIGDAGYTSYVTSNKVTMPSGVKAYKATAVNTSTIHMEEVTDLPASTPIVLGAASAGTYYLPIITTSTDDVSDNKLLASDGNVTGDESTIYALGKKNGDIGFYLVKSGVTVPAGKAYLNTESAEVKEFLTFDFDSIVDGIGDVRSKMDDVRGEIFNLAGQKMSRLQKGINIVNGRKVLVK